MRWLSYCSTTWLVDGNILWLVLYEPKLTRGYDDYFEGQRDEEFDFFNLHFSRISIFVWHFPLFNCYNIGF